MKRQEKMKQERQNNGGDHLTRLSRFLYIVGVQSVRVLKKLGRWLKKKLRPLWMFIGLWLNRLTGRWIAGLKAESRALGEGLKIARARLQKARSFGLLQMMEDVYKRQLEMGRCGDGDQQGGDRPGFSKALRYIDRNPVGEGQR